jgi:ribonucleoside-diphosphate reductase alpha chain
VFIQATEGEWSKESSLKKMVAWSRDYPSKYPQIASSRLGELMGYFVGDGSVRNDAKDAYAYLTFGVKRTAILAYLETMLLELGLKPTRRHPNERAVQLYVHSPIFSRYLIDLGVLPVKSALKEVPDSIYRMPKDAVVGFLRGLFSADGTVGYVKNKSAYIRLTSKSKLLLEGVQILLINLGIFSKIYNRARPTRKDIFPEYERKDGTRVKYSSDGVLYELEIAKDQVSSYLGDIGFIGNLHEKKLSLLKGKTYYRQKYQDRVLSVEAVGEEVVYDVTEPHTHSFIANGIVVHNCGEIPLLPYESCNLTSLVLPNHLVEKEGKWEIDWEDLARSIRLGIRFLDDMIEVNAYPLEEIRQMVKEGNRRIGLGVMGFAHMLYRMGIPYDSIEAVRMSERVAKFMRKKAEEMSLELGRERGAFSNYDVSIYSGSSEQYRNCATLMIAPTGTTSLIADTSSGIEPVFSLVQVRRSFNEDSRKNAPTREFTIVDPELNSALRKLKMINAKCQTNNKVLKNIDDIVGCICDHGLQDVKGLPKWMYKTFVTTHEIEPEWHVKIQAAWQKWIDNSVSKTINFSILHQLRM